MSDSKAAHNPIVTWGAALTGIGLIVLGLHVFLPDLAAWGYGVTPLEPNGKAYLVATGMRDLSLGLMTLYLLKHFRAAIGMFFLFMLVIPIADTAIVLMHGSNPINVLPHAVGIVAVAIISWLAFKERNVYEAIEK